MLYRTPHYSYLIEILVGGDVWKVVYAGATKRGGVRWKEHEHLVGGAPRVAASVARHGARRHRARIVHSMVVESDALMPGLPLEVRCLETYLMNKHDTVHPNLAKMRRLLAHENRDGDHHNPDILLPDQPMNFQLNCVRSAGVQHSQSISEAGRTFENQATTLAIYSEEEQQQVFDQIFKDLGVEPLETVLVCCAKKDEGTKRVVFDIDSPFMKARELRVKYEEKDGWEIVCRDAVFGEMMEVQALDPTNKDLSNYFSNLKKGFHSDKHVSLGIPMTAREAFGVFTMIESWTGAFEEAALLSTQQTNLQVQRALMWREWMRKNEGATPLVKPACSLKTDEEKKEKRCLGQQMVHWRSGHSGRHPPQEERNVYLVLLRAFPTFAQYCYGTAEKTHSNATKVNTLLRSGHGTEAARKRFPHLVNFQSKCPTCCSARPEYQMLRDYLSGQNSATEEAMLEGVEAQHATWLREKHASNVDDRKAKKVAGDKKRDAAQHASGLVKKRVRKE